MCREEKKRRVFQLYECELEMLQAQPEREKGAKGRQSVTLPSTGSLAGTGRRSFSANACSHCLGRNGKGKRRHFRQFRCGICTLRPLMEKRPTTRRSSHGTTHRPEKDEDTDGLLETPETPRHEWPDLDELAKVFMDSPPKAKRCEDVAVRNMEAELAEAVLCRAELVHEDAEGSGMENRQGLESFDVDPDMECDPMVTFCTEGRALMQQSDKLECGEEDIPAEESRRWRSVVGSLKPESFGWKYRQELEELRILWRKFEPDHEPICSVNCHGAKSIVVTAPHGISLLRGNHTPRARNVQSSQIAEKLAECLGGSSIQWSAERHQSSQILWKLSTQCGTEGCLLDPENVDPNYLTFSEASRSPWQRHLQDLAGGLQQKARLHIAIVSECKDGSELPAHLSIGLGAMQLESIASRSRVDTGCLGRVFGDCIEAELSDVMCNMLGPKRDDGEKLLWVHRELGTKEKETNLKFTGAWPPETGRVTLSQQAMLLAGFTHSIQMELSKELGTLLLRDATKLEALSNALLAAWLKAIEQIG